MGLGLSTPAHYSSTWTRQPTLRTTLQEYDICSYQEVYEKITRHHLSAGNFIDRASLLHVLPFPASACDQLTDIFDYDDDDVVNWKSCLGGVLFSVQGRILEKLHLFFQLHGRLGESISHKELQSMLLNLLSAIDRIQHASSAQKGGDSNTGVYNAASRMLNTTISSLYGNCQNSGKLRTSEIESWVKQHPEIIDGLSDVSTSTTVQAKAGSPLASSRSPLGTRRHGLHYSWQCLEPNSAGAVGPPTRTRHAMCLYDGAIYIYGGKDGNLAQKDLWRFHIVGNRWEKLQGTGERPYSLEEHTMLAHKGNLYVFGGEFGASSDIPLWMYNIDKGEWRRHSVDSEVLTPGGRRSHSAVISGSGMHVYGGYVDLKGSSSELWTFDLEHCMWHLAYSTAMSEDGAGPRHGHSAVVHDNHMWVYGGMTDLQDRDDFWKWNFDKLKWTRVKCRSQLPPLYGHSASKVANTMLLFGGQSAGVLQQDIWCFHFTTQTWQKVQCTGIPPPARTRHCAVVVTPLTLGSGSATGPRSRSVPHLRDPRPHQEGETPRPASSPACAEDMSRVNRSFRNKISPTCSLRRTENAPRTITVVPVVKQQPFSDLGTQRKSPPSQRSAAKREQYVKNPAAKYSSKSTLHRKSLNMDRLSSPPSVTGSSPDLYQEGLELASQCSARGLGDNSHRLCSRSWGTLVVDDLSGLNGFAHSLESSVDGVDTNSRTPLLPLKDRTHSGLQNPALSGGSEVELDPVVPVKRNRPSKSELARTKYASSESLCCRSPRTETLFEQSRPGSLDSLLSDFGAIGMSYPNPADVFVSSHRRISVTSHDLILEDIEDQSDALIHITGNQSEMSLHDCDSHCTTDYSALLKHVNVQSKVVGNSFVNECFERGADCSTDVPLSEHDPEGSDSESEMERQGYSRVVPTDHQPYECWLPPKYEDCAEENPPCQEKPHSVRPFLPGLASTSVDRKPPGLVVALPAEKTENGASRQEQHVPPHVWSVTSDIKNVPYPYHMYVFGGRECKSQNLGLQILPLPGWKLVIE